MQKYEIVSKETHRDLRWKPANSFKFAAKDHLCCLVLDEAPRAALHVPIAFSKATDEHFGLFALQGLEQGTNYFVNSIGEWLAGYIPAAYRGYPFALSDSGTGEQVLCIDSSSDSLSEVTGSAFFEEDGEPSAQIQKIMTFLSHIYRNHLATQALCTFLQEMDLFEPWPITVKQDEKDVTVKGIFRVNENKFNGLDAPALINLRDKGAFPLIFCQLISMQNYSTLAALAPSSGVKASAAIPSEISFDVGSTFGNLSFNDL